MLLNGTEYGYIDVDVTTTRSKFPIEGILDFRYKTAREHVNIKARRGKVVAIARKGKDYDGSIKLTQSELIAWQKAMPAGKDITDDVFSTVFTYGAEIGEITTDKLHYCRVGEVDKGMGVEDSHMEIELPLMIAEIEYDV